MGEFGQENLHGEEPFIANEPFAGIGRDRKGVDKKLKEVARTVAAFLMMFQSLPAEHKTYAQSRSRESRSELLDTSKKIASGEVRERRAYKTVTLEQILETIRTTNEEHGYFRTNKNKPNEYYAVPEAGSLVTVPINSENFPVEDGVNKVVITHTHRVAGSIREEFRTMPPCSPSVQDWKHTIAETERFSKKSIDLFTEVIDLTGIWSLNFKETEASKDLIQFFKEESGLIHSSFSGKNSSGNQAEYLDLIYTLRGMDTSSAEFQSIWQDEKYQNIVADGQHINNMLREKFPEIYTDLKRILEVQNEIMATANNNDLNRRSDLVREYVGIARKYGLEVEYKPFLRQ